VSVDPAWVFAEDDRITVALDTSLTDDLRRRGDFYELVHEVNSIRKQNGFDLSDRILLTVPAVHGGTVEAYRSEIESEVLATEIRVEGGAISIQKS
jgi:isoleucyl-tRNA synthetase